MSDVTIILTSEELQAILNELASRDPILRLLMQKQAEAVAKSKSSEPGELR